MPTKKQIQLQCSKVCDYNYTDSIICISITNSDFIQNAKLYYHFFYYVYRDISNDFLTECQDVFTALAARMEKRLADLASMQREVRQWQDLYDDMTQMLAEIESSIEENSGTSQTIDSIEMQRSQCKVNDFASFVMLAYPPLFKFNLMQVAVYLFQSQITSLGGVGLTIEIICNLCSSIVTKHVDDNCNSINLYTNNLKNLFEKLQSRFDIISSGLISHLY